MADFTGNDINDAKRRVEEMRRRSQSFVESENSGKEKIADEINHKKEKGQKPEHADSGVFDSLFSSLGLNKSDDSSSTLILALILILSKEGADNKLILALLYILL